MPPNSATALARWVREGGTLVAAPDTASYDELGRKRAYSPLCIRSNSTLRRRNNTPLEKGRHRPGPKNIPATAARLSQPYAFLATSDSGAEVVAYRTVTSLMLHIIRHEKSNAHKPVLAQNIRANIRAIFNVAGPITQFLYLFRQPSAGTSTHDPSIPHPLMRCGNSVAVAEYGKPRLKNDARTSHATSRSYKTQSKKCSPT